MENYYYQNYKVVFSSGYIMSDFIRSNELENAEIVQMFQGEKVYKEGSLYYEYQIIFKIPKND